ncbi:hypothetical protein K431DRAFT_63074 [Polychaeton citri CBS 116435]|uniref:Uncharacterized protein n=1 Tax=Polychaeton citri CBS 116435 TaxID=1314669 RepID=A0A9P4URE8_9PEZI|nr:hypothetical protein K431DRAFT_63074 [Polychaeton citri CBS 116435]
MAPDATVQLLVGSIIPAAGSAPCRRRCCDCWCGSCSCGVVRFPHCCHRAAQFDQVTSKGSGEFASFVILDSLGNTRSYNVVLVDVRLWFGGLNDDWVHGAAGTALHEW